jgi:hypothetical protein
MEFQGAQAMEMGKDLSESHLVHNREGNSDMSDLLDKSQDKRLKSDHDKHVDGMERGASSSAPLVNGQDTFLIENWLISLGAIISSIYSQLIPHADFFVSLALGRF